VFPVARREGARDGVNVMRTATHSLVAAASVEHAPLGGDWLMWRDYAVRSAGFPVDGLDVFGAV
jgi:hypothetical protein